MKISCEMAEDLLPLYIDETCSEDSRAALQEHLDSCEACREKLRRMQGEPPMPEIPEKQAELVSYVKKVRRHRVRTVILAVCVIFFTVVISTLLCMTFEDMYRTANPTIYPVEEGVWNLTVNPLTTVAEDASQYVLFTNNVKIEVTVTAETEFNGRVKLYNAEHPDDFIMISNVTPEEDTVLFSNLTAAALYIVSCEGVDGAEVTITDGRAVSFWDSLGNVLWALVDVITNPGDFISFSLF